jgi:hypothetical protein
VPCPLPRWTDPGASVGCFPKPFCLPRSSGGSAPTTSLSRPAQALHTLRPVDSLPHPRRGLSQGFDTASYPATPPASYRANRPLPGWDLHPQGDRALRGAPKNHRGSKNSGASRDLGANTERSTNAILCFSVVFRGARSSSVLEKLAFRRTTPGPGQPMPRAQAFRIDQPPGIQVRVYGRAGPAGDGITPAI